MTEALLKWFGCSVPRNQVEAEKRQLSKWADTMLNVEADARRLLNETASQTSDPSSMIQKIELSETLLDRP